MKWAAAKARAEKARKENTMGTNALEGRRSSQPGAEHQRALAIIFCLFMVLLYKQSVWDPYFNPAPKAAVTTSAVPQPTAPKPAPAEYEEPGIAAKSPEADKLPPPGVVPQGTPTDGQLMTAGTFAVETKSIRAVITLLGGRLSELSLNDYKESLEHPEKRLNMIDHIEKAPLPLGIYAGAQSDVWVQYKPVSGVPGAGGTISVPSGQKAEAVLEGQLPDGRTIRKTFTFGGDGYLIDVAASVSAPDAQQSRLSVEWTKLIPKDSPHMMDLYQMSSYVWFDGQKANRQDVSKLTSDVESFPGIRWLSLTDKYFMATLLSPEELVPATILKTGELYRGRISGGEQAVHARVFAGPKNLSVLEQTGFELKRNINFGWTAVIAAPLASLLHTLSGLFGNYGLAIVLLTIIVKLCLYPLTASSYKQMKAMQELQPEMQRIKETVADKQQQQLAMMELYKKKNVNPLGGCLPILLQMPVFFGLFSALQLSIELRHAPFAFWIHDLSAPESLLIAGVAIPVMVILFVISMLIQQWTTPSTMDPTQKKVMLAMPLLFGFMFAKMPAGLTLYWLTNNSISICQQAGLRRGGGASALKLTVASAVLVFMLAFLLVKISH